MEVEFLDVGIEGGRFESEECGGARRATDVPARLLQHGHDLGERRFFHRRASAVPASGTDSIRTRSVEFSMKMAARAHIPDLDVWVIGRDPAHSS